MRNKGFYLKKVTAFMLAAGLVAANMPAESAKAADETVVDLSTLTDGSNTDAYEYNIKEDGTYRFTGSGSNISIVVKKNTTATIIFDNATIDDSLLDDSLLDEDDDDDTEATEAVIAAKKGSYVTIQSVGTSYIKANPSASVFESAIKHTKASEGAITFSGSGTLVISGTAGDAIKYNDEGSGYVTMISGTVTITDCHGDGIDAENVAITGGTMNITTTYDDASTSYYGTSAQNNIKESGSTKTETVTYDTGSHKAIKAGTKAETFTYTSVGATSKYIAGEKNSQSASGGFTMTGGVLNLDTTQAGLKANSVSGSSYSKTSTGVYIIGGPDDGLHSNNTLSITGGTVNVASSDDGITSAGELSITGTSVINITNSYEGIEGADITIGTSSASSGPAVTIVSNDDGINAASKTVSYVYADETEASYIKTSVSSSDNSCVIYSGTVTINIDSANSHTVTLGSDSVTYGSSGDGIDCNGTLDIEGGTVYVYGQSSGDNSPIDTDDGFTLGSAATVFATGASGMSSESVPSSGSGVYISYTFGSSAGDFSQGGSPQGGPSQGGPGGLLNAPGGLSSSSTISAGSSFSVASGQTVIFSKTLPYAAEFLFYASPSLVSGSSYTITAGSTTASVTAKSAEASSSGEENTQQTMGAASENGSTDNSSTDTAQTSATTTDIALTVTDNTANSADIVTPDDSSTASKVVLTVSGTVSKGDTVKAYDNTGAVVKYIISGSNSITYDMDTTSSATKKLVVPDTVTINGTTYKVTKIAAGALKSDSHITSVRVGNNVKQIGKSTFASCSKLTMVSLGNSVLQIGANAFKGDSKLKSISITSKLKTVKKSAFKGIKSSAVFTVKASSKKAYNEIVKAITSSKSGSYTYKRKS